MDFVVEPVRLSAQRNHILVREVDWLRFCQVDQPAEMIQGVGLSCLCNDWVFRIKAECNLGPDRRDLDAGAIVRG